MATHQQEQSRKRHAEVLMSVALRCHPTALEGGKLSLASNSITHIDSIPSAVALKVRTLYLSSNSIASLEHLDQFAGLTTLSAAGNCLRYLQELRSLGALEHLEKLSLEGNVVASMPFYREHVLGLCPRLASLDNRAVLDAERSQARAEYRRVQDVLEQLRCNELRHAAMGHLMGTLKCRAELTAALIEGRPLPNRANISPAAVADRVASPLPSLASLILALCSGGVYRWVQIGCVDQLDRVVQDLALRAHLQVLRRLSQAQRMQLARRTDALAEHWQAILTEYAAYQQQQLLRLVLVYGAAREGTRLPALGGEEGQQAPPEASLDALAVLVFDCGASPTEFTRTFAGGASLAAAAVVSRGVSQAPEPDVATRSLDVEWRPHSAAFATALVDKELVAGMDKKSVARKSGLGIVVSAPPLHAPPVSATAQLKAQRAAAQTQYQSLLKTMGMGAGTAIRDGPGRVAQLSSLSSLLPPQQEEPEAHAQRGPQSKAVAPRVSASVRTKAVVGRPATATVTSATCSAGRAGRERGGKDVGCKPGRVMDSEPAFDFSSERYRSLMARAREPFNVEVGALLANLEALWLRPLPEMEIRPGATESIEAVLGPEPRDPYQRAAAASSINELKAQIQATLNELSQSQREEYLTWAASEGLRKHALATQRAVLDAADTAFGKITALSQSCAQWREDTEQARDWVRAHEGLLERVAVEAERISAVREGMLRASRRTEEAVAAKAAEERKTSEILRSTQEVNEATAVMVAEIEASPLLTRLVKSKLALTSALDMAERPGALLRKILKGWRLRVRRQRRIKRFAAACARKSAARFCIYYFGHWARGVRVSKVSTKIQRSLTKKAARRYLSFWRLLCRRSRRLSRLAKKMLRAPVRAALRGWAVVCDVGRHDRRRRKELDTMAACFVKIRVFRGWKRHAGACRPDPAVERANLVIARRFQLLTLFSSWAAVAHKEADLGHMRLGAAMEQYDRSLLAKVYKDWRLFLRVGRFAKLCGYRRCLLQLLRSCGVRKARRRTLTGVQRHHMCVLTSRYLRFWRGLTLKTNIISSAAYYVASRRRKVVVRGHWRCWVRLRQDVQHLRLKDEAAMHFYLLLLLRRHFSAWKSFSPPPSVLPAAPSAGEVLEREESIAASSAILANGLKQTIQAQITLTEQGVVKAKYFYWHSRKLKAFTRLRRWFLRRHVLRQQLRGLSTRACLHVTRGIFVVWQDNWLRSMRFRLRAPVLSHEIASVELTEASLREVLRDLQSKHARLQERAEHLTNGCAEIDAKAADMDLATREIQMVLDMHTRDLSETLSSAQKIGGECKQIKLQKEAHDAASRECHGSNAQDLLEAQVGEKESARREQQASLQNTEEHYTRAVFLQSQAQLRCDKIIAEIRATVQMQKHHRQEVKSRDKEIQELDSKRLQTEKALALCVHSLQTVLESMSSQVRKAFHFLIVLSLLDLIHLSLS